MINKINVFFERHKNLLLFLIVFSFILFYFTYAVTILWDTAHYMTYVEILEGNLDWVNWDVVRGPVFPLLIYFSNLVFGKTVQGLLFLTFVFYLIMLYVVYKMLMNILKNNKYKNVLIVLIEFLIIINPIIYGFYHALLTEFVAITISILTCYLSWKYITQIDETNNSKKKVLYIILFSLLCLFGWFLKQPYISTTFFPVLIALILSMIDRFNLKNIINKCIVIVSCVVTLFLGINLWNKFLESKGLNTNSSRNPSVSLGEQLIGAVENIEITEETDYNVFDIENLKLSKKEKQTVLEIIKNKGDFKIVSVKKENKIIEQYFYKTEVLSLKDSLFLLIKITFKHPIYVLDTYATNYLSIIDVYGTTTSNGIGYVSTKKVDLKFSNEISSIGFRPYSYNSNTFYMLEEAYERVQNYEQFNQAPKVLNYGMRVLGILALILFKLEFILLPWVLIYSIYYKFKQKKLSSEINLVIILLSYSLLHILLHTVTGAIIDRYAVPAYLTTFLGIFILGYLRITNKRTKKL